LDEVEGYLLNALNNPDFVSTAFKYLSIQFKEKESFSSLNYNFFRVSELLNYSFLILIDGTAVRSSGRNFYHWALLVPACPTEKVTLSEGLPYLTLGSETDKGVAKDKVFAQTGN